MTARRRACHACRPSASAAGRGPLLWGRGQDLRCDLARTAADWIGAALPEAAGEHEVRAAKGPVVITFICGGACCRCTKRLRTLRAMLPQAAGSGASLVAIRPQPRVGRGQVARHAWEMVEIFTGPDDAARPSRLAAPHRAAAADGPDGQGSLTVGDPHGICAAAPATYVVAQDGRAGLVVVEEHQGQLKPRHLTAALDRLHARSMARLSDVTRWMASPPGLPEERWLAARVTAPLPCPSRGY